MTRTDWLTIIDEIGPHFEEGADQRDAEDTFIAEHYPVLRERGIVDAMVPAELGGGGASHSDVCAMLRRLGYYDGATALAMAMHQHLVAAQVYNHLHGKPAPILRRIVDDKLVLVSTGARDWLGSNGEMRRVDGGYRLNARKAFASGSMAGDIAITSAPYEHPTEGSQVLHFPVSMRAEGVRIETDWRAHGMRATGSHTVVFDDVFVPDAAIKLARPRGSFHPVWNVVLTVAMPLIMSAYVGVAERAVDLALERARGRRNDPLTQLSAGEARSAATVAVALHDQMVSLANDLDFAPVVEISNDILILKAAAADAVQRATEASMEAAGGSGFYRRNGIERLIRDARASAFHPLADKPQKLFTGRMALGLDPIDL